MYKYLVLPSCSCAVPSPLLIAQLCVFIFARSEGSGVSVSTFTSPAFYNGMAFNAVLASHK